MAKCPACGELTAAGDRFCAHCGAPLAGARPDWMEHTGSITSVVHTAGPTSTGSGALSHFGSGERTDMPSGTAMLVVMRGPGEGSEFELGGKDLVTIGRAQESDVFLDDVTVSRRHAEIRHGATGWSIRDAGSLNGTYVNREIVDDRQLQPGDEIQIGKFRFAFLVGIA